MESSIKIRKFTSNDMEGLKEIEEASIKFLTPLSSLLYFYEIDPEGFLVAEVNGRIIGYVIGNMEKDLEGHILAVATDPNHRRQGVGTQLMRAIIHILRDKGAERIRVELKPYNTDAQKFYSSLGFEQSHKIRGYYMMRGYTEDALIMIKNLH